jgi:hypothetical protein
MPKRPSTRTRAHPRLLASVAMMAVGLCQLATAQGSGEPGYLKNRADPVQEIYSRAVLGYALNQKCRHLDASATETYERQLNQATVVFQGYVIAQRFVPSPNDAIPYTQGLLRGAARFAGSSQCDARAHDRVQQGYQTAQSFMPLIRDLLSAPAPKQ